MSILHKVKSFFKPAEKAVRNCMACLAPARSNATRSNAPRSNATRHFDLTSSAHRGARPMFRAPIYPDYGNPAPRLTSIRGAALASRGAQTTGGPAPRLPPVHTGVLVSSDVVGHSVGPPAPRLSGGRRQARGTYQRYYDVGKGKWYTVYTP